MTELERIKSYMKLKGRSDVMLELTVDTRRHLERWKDEVADEGRDLKSGGWYHDIKWRIEAIQMLVHGVIEELNMLDADGGDNNG